MEKKILYLGLRPPLHVIHYPVIKTRYLGNIQSALALWEKFTHVIFTSQTTVEFWRGPWDKKTIAIGPATYKKLEEMGLKPILSLESTQEGIMDLIENMEGYFFLPHSNLARSDLIDFMKKKRILHFALPIYETLFNVPDFSIDLEKIDEIVFTSPSTVDGFLKIFKKIPEGKKLTCIGPITKMRLDRF